MSNEIPLPGFEEAARRNAELRARLEEEDHTALIDACLALIAAENRRTLTRRSWAVLQLSTALKRFRDGRS
jgi:hypothetical protein